jgi:uncharacterized protein (TIGR03089 family)
MGPQHRGHAIKTEIVPPTLAGVPASGLPSLPTPSALVDPGRFADPAAPLITYYNDHTGERTELSARTLDNWVAKTASFGTDLMDLEPGATVRLGLSRHWLGVVWVLAALRAGWQLTDSGHAEVVVLDEVTVADGADTDGRLVCVSTRPLARSFGVDLPPRAEDYAAEIGGCADVFHPMAVHTGTAADQQALLEEAADRARDLGLGSPADRLLIGSDPVRGGRLLMLGALAARASLVLVDGLSGERLDSVAATENVTHRVDQ